MFLLYLDDSGDPDDPNINHFVLGGVAVFERQTHWIGKELDKIAARFDPAEPANIELHGNPMVQGNKGWRPFGQEERAAAIQDSLAAFAKTHTNNVAFAIVIEKDTVKDIDPVEHAFEMLLNRFDRYLRMLHARGNTQRGLIVMDESSYEHRFQGLAKNFRDNGHRWGQLHNIAEVPLFVDYRETRLIQLADLVSYSVFRYYEKQDRRFLPYIQNKFIGDGHDSTLIKWVKSKKATDTTLSIKETNVLLVEDKGGIAAAVSEQVVSVHATSDADIKETDPAKRRGRRNRAG